MLERLHQNGRFEQGIDIRPGLLSNCKWVRERFQHDLTFGELLGGGLTLFTQPMQVHAIYLDNALLRLFLSINYG